MTIGDNSNAIDDNTPTISGKKTGIKNNNTLNYYDGTIIGKSAIDGNVQDAPESYGPVGAYREEDGMTVVNLKVISDYVARIDWFYYSTLQSAFDACNASEDNTVQTTIHIIRDIILEDTVTTYMGQNIRLDLNGYMLTNSNNTVLNISNDSKLEIADLTEEQNGNITSSIVGTVGYYYKMISNNGYLKISGGTILSEQNYNYPIYNENGKIEITDGQINSINSHTASTYGIYNLGNGTIYISGGQINSESKSYAYGIYNRDSGIIDIKGGSINSKGTNASGIYNASNKDINMSNNTINSEKYAINNVGSGIINVTKGVFYCNEDGIHNEIGTINLIEIMINVNNAYDANGIYNDSGTISMIGGEINCSASYSATGIYNNTGIVHIENAKIQSSNNDISDRVTYTKGIDNNSGKIEIINSTVYANTYKGYISSSASGIENVSGNIKIESGIINATLGLDCSSGELYGINNSQNGEITIDKSSINSKSESIDADSEAYGIFNNSGTINIGTKNDEIVSDNNPEIIEINTKEHIGYGIYNTLGKINFYDGFIQATDNIIYGGITEIEDNYEIIEEENQQEEYKKIYLEQQNLDTFIVEDISTGKKYIKLEDAIDEITENQGELKILEDFTILTGSFIIPENIKLTIDLNGKTIINKYFQSINYGNFEITDKAQNGKIESKNIPLINENNGHISLTGGEISFDSCGIENNSSGILEMTSGKISTVSDKAMYISTISNNAEGTIYITGGEIDSTAKDYSYVISNESNGFVYVSDVKISTNGTMRNTGIRNRASGTINISNVIFDNCYYGIENNSNGIIDITNSIFNNSSYGIYNYRGTINVIEGEISFINSSRGVAYGIYNYSTGTINITAGEISSSSSSAAYGIYNYSTGTINVTGGKISSNGYNSTYGIYNRSTGTVTIGTKGDGIVGTDEPNIIATYAGTSTSYGGYGIYNRTGTVNFYDGRIEGSTLAVEGNSEITEVEEVQLPQYSDDMKIYAYGIEASAVAQIGNTTYLSLQDAINEANENDVIEILRGIQYTNQDVTLTIPSGKSITIDLQNNPIISAIEDAMFTVEGNLKVINTVEGTNGRISSSYENTIYVKQGGTLEINGGTVTNHRKR